MASNQRGQITIIGLGLIGGSLGLALKGAGTQHLELVGFDRSGAAMTAARKRGAVDRTEGDLRRAVREAAMVVVATPLAAMRVLFQEMAPHLQAGATVTDTGSTKAAVLQWAREELPESVSFVGGHPMAGKETGGIDAAEANLFRGRTYCVVPAPAASPGAVESVLGLVEAVGGRPWFVDAEEHDRYAAAVSHLPALLSEALFLMARDAPAWPELSMMAGPAFRDLTRLASSDPDLLADTFATNREAVLHWLGRFEEQLRRQRELLQEGQEKALYELLARAQLERDRFLQEGPALRVPEGVEVPRTGETLAAMLVGGRFARRMRELTSGRGGDERRRREP